MTKSEDRLAKYWEEQFDVGELKWNEAFEELDQTLLEKWNAKKESIIAESTDHKGKCFSEEF